VGLYKLAALCNNACHTKRPHRPPLWSVVDTQTGHWDLASSTCILALFKL